MTPTHIQKNNAFSLIEMSMILIIIAAISGGMISMSISQHEQASNDQTKNKYMVIENAFTAFLSVNGRLPCPANPDLSRNDSNFGIEQCGCDNYRQNIENLPDSYSCIASSHVVRGDIPFATIGLPKQFAYDGWGNKILYVVSEAFTASNNGECAIGNPTQPFKFNDCNKGLIKILDKYQSVKVDDAVFILLSYGANRLGSYSEKSTNRNQLPNAQSIESVNANMDGTFVAILPEKSDRASLYFDDILLYRTKRQLLSNINVILSNEICDIADEVLNSNDLLCGENPNSQNCAPYMSNLANRIKKLCL